MCSSDLVICEEYPDLVICDIMLKGMSGEELSSKLKTSRDTSFIPINVSQDNP